MIRRLDGQHYVVPKLMQVDMREGQVFGCDGMPLKQMTARFLVLSTGNIRPARSQHTFKKSKIQRSPNEINEAYGRGLDGVMRLP